MRISILLVALALLLSVWSAQGESTVLTYIVEREIDQEDQYIQADGRSLREAIETGARIIKNIKEIAIEDCEKSAADKDAKKQCKEIVDDSKFQVQPKYHMVRKIPTFTLFILTHEVTIKIKNIKGIGKLTDEIINAGEDLVTLQEFIWKADEELDPEVETLRDGLQEGKELCQKFGKKFEEVLSVEELEAPEEEEEDDERDADLAEVDVHLTIYKFKIKCADVKGKSAKGK